MSRPPGSASDASSTMISPSPQPSIDPAERADAKKRISVVVRGGDVDAAVTAVHSAFDLDAAETEAVVYGGTGR